MCLVFINTSPLSQDSQNMSARQSTSPPPSKRPRHSSTSQPNGNSNANTPTAASGQSTTGTSAQLPPLSLSILGVEPLDEFIKEVADFVHFMISTRPEPSLNAQVEVEAKIGVLRDRLSGQRLMLPVLVETSESQVLLSFPMSV
jgi:polynucleotide 5'-triphosphatase